MSTELDQLSLSLGSISVSPQSATSALSNDTKNDTSHLSRRSVSRDSSSFRAGSPSSTMTARRNDPFAFSLSDPNFQQQPSCSLRRRSSHLSRWLLELQIQSTPSITSDVQDLSDVEPVGTISNPYLAYPHMSMAAVRRNLPDVDSMHDYVLIDDNIALECPPQTSHDEQSSYDAMESESVTSPRSTIRLSTAQSLRHLRVSRHSVSPAPTTTVSRSPSRLSMFQRASRSDLTSTTSMPLASRHARSASAQATPSPGFQITLTQRSNSWRWRPSVLGHFSSSSIPDAHINLGDSPPNQSRPSMSSTNTCSSTTAPTTMYEDGDSPVPSIPPSKSSSLFGSLRARSHTGVTTFFKNDFGSASSPALRPLPPASAPPLSGSRAVSVSLPNKGETIRSSFIPKHRPNQSGALNQIFVEELDDSQPHVLYGSKGHRLSLSSFTGPVRQAKKKKLVIGGIARNDTRRLEAIQKWCQSFGEVEQIIRMPNGNLHVMFQKAEVADTVCRVRAQVQIPGADSVHLSWISGNKRI